MTLVDLLLHEVMNLVGWKRNDTTLPYIMLKEVVNLVSASSIGGLFSNHYDASEVVYYRQCSEVIGRPREGIVGEVRQSEVVGAKK